MIGLTPTTPGIYAIVCLDNDKMYVGQSVNLRRRLRRHIGALNQGEHHNHHLQNAFNKFGADAFYIDLLVPSCATTDLDELEAFYIAHLGKDGFNLVLEQFEGPRQHSEETLRKIGKGNRGKTVGAESRAKISAALKGRPFSAETRARISAANKGRVASEESKAKMRASALSRVPNPAAWAKIAEANRGKTRLGQGPKTRQTMLARGYAHAITFDGETKSLNEWARERGMSPGTLSNRINRGWPLGRALNEPPRRRAV